jgi:hypothetical protein
MGVWREMQKWKIYGLIAVLICVLMFAPVSAWHPSVTKSGPGVACPTCEYYTYTINASSLTWNDYMFEVRDTLPIGLSFVSSSPAPSTISGQTLTWDFVNVPANSWRNITLNVKPSGSLTSISNTAQARVRGCQHFISGTCTDTSNMGWESWIPSGQVTTRFDTKVCPPDVPEFPSTAIPATFIIGFLGTVLFIRRTREN